MVNSHTAQVEPINASSEPERLIQPRCAAQQTTAGAVRERSPATRPMANVSTNPGPKLINRPPGELQIQERAQPMTKWMKPLIAGCKLSAHLLIRRTTADVGFSGEVMGILNLHDRL